MPAAPQLARCVCRGPSAGHFTLLFEQLAIAWLKEAMLLAVARRFG
ncbi:MAG: hypothetical protein JWM95_2810 [Gemmatimonadetes bacterium]|nr:hypothetical protein [Gemmatimonadota bacterium]